MYGIDCCDRWTDCAGIGICVARDKDYNCTYAHHLKNGFNFLNAYFKNRHYLMIDQRLFYFGAKSSHDFFSFALTDDQVKSLQLKHSLQFSTFSMTHARVEHATDENPCSYRVIVTIGEAEYAILNANGRMLQHLTAVYICDYFRHTGNISRIERMGAPAKPQKPPAAATITTSSMAIATPQFTKKNDPANADPLLPLPGQISIFD